MAKAAGFKRVIIEGIEPEVDGGRFAAKGIVGQPVHVEAHVLADGHDELVAILKHRAKGERNWREVPMSLRWNDEWYAEFVPEKIGQHQFTVMAWVDHFATWRRDLGKKIAADQDVSVDVLYGLQLVVHARKRATGDVRKQLADVAHAVEATHDTKTRIEILMDLSLGELMSRLPDRKAVTTYGKEVPVWVDRPKAGFSTWYELFPRSWGAVPGKHGTFRDLEAKLPHLASMGFDVLYLPPIHPIGRAFRKGRNNRLAAEVTDPGSPWAIGGPEGGHKSIHPELGTFEDFRHLIAKATEYGLEVAIDIAYQCSPDHPYVKEHPEWFKIRPDGSIQYAENPPKKYQDIYPFNFENDKWQELWEELKSVLIFWVEQGVKIFRVDNPHTKPFAFWEWAIGEVRKDYPEAIFLSEAFTRPKIMYQLAKLGFTQSYTYFTWRNTKQDLTDYFNELTQSSARHFFRPNAWPNTPDILHEYLQKGGRGAHMARLVLAATLSANYGMYGPAFELMDSKPREPGSEEYLNSEKYEIREWNLDSPESLRPYIARVNAARRDNPALQNDRTLHFHPTTNDQIICYSKHDHTRKNVILTIVNLDPHHVQSGWVDLHLDALGIDGTGAYQVHDLLSDNRYEWQGAHNYIELNPSSSPAHIFKLDKLAIG